MRMRLACVLRVSCVCLSCPTPPHNLLIHYSLTYLHYFYMLHSITPIKLIFTPRTTLYDYKYIPMTNLPELLEFGDSRLPEHTKDLPFEIRHISPATGFGTLFSPFFPSPLPSSLLLSLWICFINDVTLGVFSKVDITEGTSLFVEAPLVNFPLFTFPEPILKKSVCSYPFDFIFIFIFLL